MLPIARADRLRTEQLNRQALEIGKPRITYHDHDHDRRVYEVAREQYERELVEWRERVAAYRAGDWSGLRVIAPDHPAILFAFEKC